MPTQFDLIITADHPKHTAEFRLLDAHGGQLARRQTDFKTITAGHLHGLFDLRNYLRVYVEAGREVAAVAEIGVCIAEDVLGQDIFERLWQSESQRPLRIQLPEGGAAGKPSGRRTGPRAVGNRPPQPRPADAGRTQPAGPRRPRHASSGLGTGGTGGRQTAARAVRLCRGPRPLGARQERRDLLRLFEKETYPQRRVVAH